MLDTVKQVLFAKVLTVIHAILLHAQGVEAVSITREIGIDALLVTDAGWLVGIVVERDIIAEVVADRCDPDDTWIGQVPTNAPVCTPPYMPVRDAMALIGDRHMPASAGR